MVLLNVSPGSQKKAVNLVFGSTMECRSLAGLLVSSMALHLKVGMFGYLVPWTNTQKSFGVWWAVTHEYSKFMQARCSDARKVADLRYHGKLWCYCVPWPSSSLLFAISLIVVRPS